MNSLLATAAAVLLVIMIMLITAAFHRRRRPSAPAQPPLPEGWDDRHFAHAHGLTLLQWATLTPEKKTELRLSAAHGKGWQR